MAGLCASTLLPVVTLLWCGVLVRVVVLRVMVQVGGRCVCDKLLVKWLLLLLLVTLKAVAAAAAGAMELWYCR